MKVISKPESVLTARETCLCGAVLEYTDKDMKYDEREYVHYIVCPVCGQQIAVKSPKLQAMKACFIEAIKQKKK